VIFVLIREIEKDRRDCQTFDFEGAAWAAYRVAERVSMDGPDDGPGDDPTIVTNGSLYVAYTSSVAEAVQLARYKQANLLAECFPATKP